MTCTACGGDTEVTQSKRWYPAPESTIHLVRRRRSCLRCNERFWTYEQREGGPEDLVLALEKVQQEKLDRLVAFAQELAGSGAAGR